MSAPRRSPRPRVTRDAKVSALALARAASLGVASLAVASLGCSAASAPPLELEVAPPASVSASPPPSARPTALAKPEEGAIPWVTNDARAFALAKSGRQPIVVVLCAGWATPCVEAERTLWKSAAVARAMAPFVALRIDLTDDDTTSRGLVERYTVDVVPTVLLLDEDGREVERLKGMPSEPTLIAALARVAGR